MQGGARRGHAGAPCSCACLVVEDAAGWLQRGCTAVRPFVAIGTNVALLPLRVREDCLARQIVVSPPATNG